MSDLITESAKQVPALALLVVVVWIFIRYIGEQNQLMLDAFSTLMKEHIDQREQGRLAIVDNTLALRENAETRGSLIEVMREMREAQKQ